MKEYLMKKKAIAEQIEYMEKLRASSGICYDEMEYEEEKEKDYE